jgi:hypothetical protein
MRQRVSKVGILRFKIEDFVSGQSYGTY